jgi:hypothetical protein
VSSVSGILKDDIARKTPHLSLVEIRRRLDPLELISELLDRVGKAVRNEQVLLTPGEQICGRLRRSECTYLRTLPAP